MWVWKVFLGRGLGGRGVELFLDFLIKRFSFLDFEGAINQSVIKGENSEKLQVWGSIGKEVLGT